MSRWYLFGTVLWLSISLGLQAQTYTDLYNCYTDTCNFSYPALLAQGRNGNLYGTTSIGGTHNLGTVFTITPSGTLATLYSFDTTTGANPSSGLTLGLDGSFYGTTEFGGTYHAGTIFKITPEGTLTTLHSFAGDITDGAWPFTAPVQGDDGYLYGVTEVNRVAAGWTGIGYRISSTGAYKILSSSLPGSPNPFWAPLIQAIDGNFYSTTYNGGVNNSGTIFRMSRTGAVKIIYNFDTTHGGWGYAPLVQDDAGYLYGTEDQGGSLGGGVVFKVTIGGKLTVLHNFVHQDSTDGSSPVAGLVLASNGKFYGSTYRGNPNNWGVLFSVTRTGAYTSLYNFDGTHGGEVEATAMQHTNGKMYGLAQWGGPYYDGGVVYSFDVGLEPFVSMLTKSGKVGDVVQILGQGFTRTSKVTFGVGAANYSVISDTFMTAIVPSSGTTGPVIVTTASGTLVSNRKFRVLPTISSFAPTSGPVGTKVTITGSGFIGATKVTFGGVKAISYTVDSGTQITATVPTGAKKGNIAVTTPGGSASKGTFTVI
jgi:uncharacterized repeat protein (TIGR03803 family)